MPIGIRVTDLPAAAGTLDDDDEFLSLEDGSLRRATRTQAGPKASIVQVADTANQFTGTNVEGVLAEIQDNVDALVISGGGMSVASEAEALAGTDNTKAMTPLRVKTVLPWIDVRQHGAVGDGVTDDTAAIEAAHAAVDEGGTIVLPPGTYQADSTIDLSGKSVRVHAVGATITSSQVNVMKLGGTLTLAATTVNGDLAAGATSVIVASAAGLAVGDLIRLRSSGEVFNDERPTVYYKGELAEITNIAGTTLTLRCGLNDSYDATTYTVTVDRIQAKAVHVQGLTLVGTPGVDQYGLQVEAFRGATITDVSIVDCEYVGMRTYCGIGATISGATVTGSDDSATGYGIQIVDSDGVTVKGSHGWGNRHSFECGGTAPSRNITFEGCTAKGDSMAGFSSHGDTDRITWRDCSSEWCGGGFVARGSNSLFDGCRVRGVRTDGFATAEGIRIGDGAPNIVGNGRAGRGLRVTNCHVDLTGSGTALETHGMNITAATDDAKIDNCTFKGHNHHGLNFTGFTNRELSITNTLIDSSLASKANAYGLLIVPSTNAAGRNTRGLRIRNNRLVGDGGTNAVQAIRLHGGTDVTTPSDRIYVTDNDIESWATGINPSTSTYFKRGTFQDNIFTSVTVPIGMSATQEAHWELSPIRWANETTVRVREVLARSGAAPTTGVWIRGDRIGREDAAASSSPGWVCTTTGGASSAVWAATTAYTVGQFIRTSGNKVLACVTAGTSSGVEPNPATLHTTLTDGTVTWVYRASTLAVFKAEPALLA